MVLETVVNKTLNVKICGKQFVKNPSPHYRISDKKRALVDKLLLEKISLADIAHVVEASERWLQYYVNDKYKKLDNSAI